MQELMIDHLTIRKPSGIFPVNIGLHSPVESYENDIDLDIAEVRRLIEFLERAIE